MQTSREIERCLVASVERRRVINLASEMRIEHCVVETSPVVKPSLAHTTTCASLLHPLSDESCPGRLSMRTPQFPKSRSLIGRSHLHRDPCQRRRTTAHRRLPSPSDFASLVLRGWRGLHPRLEHATAMNQRSKTTAKRFGMVLLRPLRLAGSHQTRSPERCASVRSDRVSKVRVAVVTGNRV